MSKAWCPACGVDFEHTDMTRLPGYCPECHEKLNKSLARQLLEVPLFAGIARAVQRVISNNPLEGRK